MAKIKITVRNGIGCYTGHCYADVKLDLGGYAPLKYAAMYATENFCLDHGDTIKIEFLDRLEGDERTSEDERVLAAA